MVFHEHLNRTKELSSGCRTIGKYHASILQTYPKSLLHTQNIKKERTKEMIRITKNPNGDTRTAPKGITFEQFQQANNMHIQDVQSVMWELSRMVDKAGDLHDYTKKTHEREFYRDFVNTQENGADFVNSEWYQLHVNAERHHLLSNCPDDVNLIDVLEMVADCTCAGLARSGEIRALEINSEILDRAVKNTAELIKSMVQVIE